MVTPGLDPKVTFCVVVSKAYVGRRATPDQDLGQARPPQRNPMGKNRPAKGGAAGTNAVGARGF